MTGIGQSDAAALLRRGVIALGVLGLAGTVLELVFLRHWGTATALIVWVGILALALGFVALARRPTRRVVLGVRILAAVGLIVSIAGVGFHVVENLTAGPLDRVYAATWDTMPSPEQWWTAITGGVGPAPTLAPGALAEIALALLLATLWRPAA